MSGHTPGPWFVMPDGFGKYKCPTVYATGEELRYIALCDDFINMTPTDNHANAKLIAAAPEMLEALKLAEEAMDYLGDILNGSDMATEEDEEKTTPAFEAVRAAIAKAEGVTK